MTSVKCEVLTAKNVPKCDTVYFGISLPAYTTIPIHCFALKVGVALLELPSETFLLIDEAESAMVATVNK
jgi:hypothetical protein